MPVRDVIIVGGGPAGLAAAIAARQAGLDVVVLEKGALVNTLLHYPTNMIYFTTPELLEIGGLPFVTPNEKPNRFEALKYYRRVTDAFALPVELDEEVRSIAVESDGTLAVATMSRLGVERVQHARTVVLAMGAFDRANRLDVPGEDLPHVSHYYSESHPFYRKDVVIVGGSNSAADAALDLYRNGARVTIVHRQSHFSNSIKYWVRPDLENRVREGAIAARLEARVAEIRPATVLVEQYGASEELPADAVFLLTGYHCAPDVMVRAGVHVDPVTYRPDHDSATFETNVPNLFVIGSMITGRQSGQIFIENGRFHGQRVIEVIAGRLAGVPART